MTRYSVFEVTKQLTQYIQFKTKLLQNKISTLWDNYPWLTVHFASTSLFGCWIQMSNTTAQLFPLLSSSLLSFIFSRTNNIIVQIISPHVSIVIWPSPIRSSFIFLKTINFFAFSLPLSPTHTNTGHLRREQSAGVNELFKRVWLITYSPSRSGMVIFVVCSDNNQARCL